MVGHGGAMAKEDALSLEALPQISQDLRGHLVVRVLRDAIITGSLRPGDRLVERDLSERMGISRGPVREALRQLQQEGLVVSFPYRGTEVAGISREEVEEILVPLRLVLERFAFRHALPSMTERDFAELEGLVAAMREAARKEDLAGVVDADVRFHELVFAKSGQSHCTQVWQTIVPRVRAYFYRDAPRHPSLEHIAEGHEELLAAIRTKDMGKVQPVLDEHILETIYLDEGSAFRERAEASLGALEEIARARNADAR